MLEGSLTEGCRLINCRNSSVCTFRIAISDVDFHHSSPHLFSLKTCLPNSSALFPNNVAVMALPQAFFSDVN